MFLNNQTTEQFGFASKDKTTVGIYRLDDIHHLKESNDMEELISECIKYIDDEIGAHIASAFFLHFNANVFTLVSACPNDFRREIQVNEVINILNKN